MVLTTTDGGRSLVGGPSTITRGENMAKMQVTVPVCIGGKPFAAGDVVEVDEHDARALIAIRRACPYAEPTETTPAGTAPTEEDGGDKKGRKK